MSENVVYIAFPRGLYVDLVRFSEGKISPELLAEDLVRGWVEDSILDAWGDDDRWGQHQIEVAKIYAPDKYKDLLKSLEEEAFGRSIQRALIWKEISVPEGTEVRMSYGGKSHFARIQGGKIVDQEGEFSPSEWASKVAGGTSRNAWRDLFFKKAGEKSWTAASQLRHKARARGAE